MLLAIDKPHGRTSYDCIRYIKKQFPGQKIGHAGTLDPYATGLLIVAVWSDTKNSIIDSDNTKPIIQRSIWVNQAIHEICNIGKNINNILFRTMELLSMENIKSDHHSMRLILCYNPSSPALHACTSIFCQKIKWAHSYDLARSGTLIQQHKMMTFDTIQVLSYHFPTIQLEVTVWSGTYIRSLAYRIGTQYEMGGLLTSLRRICIWPVHVPTHNTHGDDKLIIGEIILS